MSPLRSSRSFRRRISATPDLGGSAHEYFTAQYPCGTAAVIAWGRWPPGLGQRRGQCSTISGSGTRSGFVNPDPQNYPLAVATWKVPVVAELLGRTAPACDVLPVFGLGGINSNDLHRADRDSDVKCHRSLARNYYAVSSCFPPVVPDLLSTTQYPFLHRVTHERV